MQAYRYRASSSPPLYHARSAPLPVRERMKVRVQLQRAARFRTPDSPSRIPSHFTAASAEQFRRPRRPPLHQPLAQFRVAQRNYLCRQQPRIRRTGLANRHRRDRHTLRHLHNRQQRIHAVERRVGIGTPITGRIVFAATTPARCAAPPAPAIIARSPRPAALAEYSRVMSGVRCADMTRTSCGT